MIEAGAAEARIETANGIADWLDFAKTPRKIICRRRHARSFTLVERAAMEAARTYQDEGRISILTRRNPAGIVYVAERVA